MSESELVTKLQNYTQNVFAKLSTGNPTDGQKKSMGLAEQTSSIPGQPIQPAANSQTDPIGLAKNLLGAEESGENKNGNLFLMA